MSLDVDVLVDRDGFRLQATLSIEPRETVALLGPNGAGKSTLVGVLAGLIPEARGRVTLDGTVLQEGEFSAPPDERPIGVVFQDLLLFPNLSVVENVAFPLRARGVRRGQSLARARSLLERMGLTDRITARPRHLSGGESQRVALARALIHEPSLLLLDEPLSALDASARPRLRTLLLETLEGFTGYRLLVTHDPVEAMTLASRLVLLEDGRITQTGEPEAIRAAPRTPYAADLVGVNLFRGDLVPLGQGVGSLETGIGALLVAWPPLEERAVADVIGILRPADVSLFRTRPEGSARNAIRGEITSVTFEGHRARVAIQGAPPLVAEITAGSVSRLSLSPGSEVWASFKAVEVRLILPGAQAP